MSREWLGPDVSYFGRKGQDIIISEKGYSDNGLYSRGVTVQTHRLTDRRKLHIIQRGAGEKSSVSQRVMTTYECPYISLEWLKDIGSGCPKIFVGHWCE
jgi:hypothetical protein